MWFTERFIGDYGKNSNGLLYANDTLPSYAAEKFSLILACLLFSYLKLRSISSRQNFLTVSEKEKEGFKPGMKQ